MPEEVRVARLAAERVSESFHHRREASISGRAHGPVRVFDLIGERGAWPQFKADPSNKGFEQRVHLRVGRSQTRQFFEDGRVVGKPSDALAV